MVAPPKPRARGAFWASSRCRRWAPAPPARVTQAQAPAPAASSPVICRRHQAPEAIPVREAALPAVRTLCGSRHVQRAAPELPAWACPAAWAAAREAGQTSWDCASTDNFLGIWEFYANSLFKPHRIPQPSDGTRPRYTVGGLSRSKCPSERPLRPPRAAPRGVRAHRDHC